MNKAIDKMGDLESAIVDLLRRSKTPLNITEIADRINLNITRRTFQRTLKTLLDTGYITTSGKGPATVYESVALEEKATIEGIPLSDTAKEILQKVSMPVQQRMPVGYNKQFLESYIPNKTNYLSPKDKEELAKAGTTAQLKEPAGTYAKQILQRLLIDLAWNSSRLEGNTYSLLDTKALIDYGKTSDGKSSLETQMILNHKDAIEFIVNNPEDIGFNSYTIKNLHGLLSNNLLPDPASSGALRTHGIGIGGSVYTPLAVPQLIEEIFKVLLEKAEAIENPFEQAFFIMVHLPYLQPFDDVNKRVSRLAANIPFNKRNLSPLSFIDVPQELYVNGLLGVYELNQVELLKDIFTWAYLRSAQQYAAQRQSLGEPDEFRLQYRDAIRQLVSEIVTENVTNGNADLLIQTKALQIPDNARDKFVQTVKTELVSLHDGNIARYSIRPSQYHKWKESQAK